RKSYLFNNEEDVFLMETVDSTFYILTSNIFNDAIKATDKEELYDLIVDFFYQYKIHPFQNALPLIEYYDDIKFPLSTIIYNLSNQYDMKYISSLYDGRQVVIFIDSCSLLNPFLIQIEHAE